MFLALLMVTFVAAVVVSVVVVRLSPRRSVQYTR
jgi:hypothetical protein